MRSSMLRSLKFAAQRVMRPRPAAGAASTPRAAFLAAGRLLFAVLAAVALVLPLPTAEAQARRPGPPGPILAVVSLAKQRIWVYGSAGLIAQSAVSTGMQGHRTPTGVFSIVQKSRFHRSNIYSDAPMPYMQRITWSGIALHAGVVPGHPASHGCIRLPHQFAVELWGLTRIGARVVVVPDDPSVFDIEHPRLPAPAMLAMPADANPVPGVESREPEAVEGRAPGIVDAAAREEPDGEQPPAASSKLVNPLERAKAARRHAVTDAAAKAKAAKAALRASALKAAEASRTIAVLRMAELALTTALARRDAAAKALQGAPDAPKAAEALASALIEAEARLAAAGKAAEEARALEAVKTPEAIAVAKAAWQAQQANTQAVAALKATQRNTEPISVFVSKKAGKVYIRQAWVPIHEGAATFKDPELPLGTHVYVAKAAEDDGRTLRWLSVSLPPSQPPPPRKSAGRDEPVQQASLPPAFTEHLVPNAASVLERFELEEETRAFIADRLWAGASLIVSDEAMSRETGATTDFIVVTR
jgi:L,D-transpeptidase catalytic domain